MCWCRGMIKQEAMKPGESTLHSSLLNHSSVTQRFKPLFSCVHFRGPPQSENILTAESAKNRRETRALLLCVFMRSLRLNPFPFGCGCAALGLSRFHGFLLNL